MNDSLEIRNLLKEIARDNEQAFTKFYNYYYETIYRFTTYFIRDTRLIQETVSDVFFNVWKCRKRLLHVENIDAYLYATTRNRAIYYLKQHKQDIISEDVGQISLKLKTENQTPEDVAINEELANKIHSSINSLPDKCRLIFLMAREEGLKYREIARILSISEKTVNAQMVIAIKKLGKIIQEYLSMVIF